MISGTKNPQWIYVLESFTRGLITTLSELDQKERMKYRSMTCLFTTTPKTKGTTRLLLPILEGWNLRVTATCFSRCSVETAVNSRTIEVEKNVHILMSEMNFKSRLFALIWQNLACAEVAKTFSRITTRCKVSDS